MRKRSPMVDVFERDSGINQAVLPFPQNRWLQASANNSVCRLDNETGSYGEGVDEDESETSEETEGVVETKDASFIYQVETIGTLSDSALKALELFMTEHMLGYILDDCKILSSAESDLQGLRTLRDRYKSNTRIRKENVVQDQGRRRAEDTMQLAVLGLSWSPPDERIREEDIKCKDHVSNETDCVVVEGKVLIATNTSAGGIVEIHSFYHDAIRSTIQDEAINWTEANQTIVNVTYRGENKNAARERSRPRFERMWIPGVTMLSFFVALLIVFLVYDRRSAHRKRWEQRKRGDAKFERGDAQLGLSGRIDEDPNEDQESSDGEGEKEGKNLNKRISSFGGTEVVLGEDGSIETVEDTKMGATGVSTSSLLPADSGDLPSYVDALDSRYQQEVASLKKEIDALDPRIDEIMQASDSDSEYTPHIRTALEPVQVHTTPPLTKVKESRQSLLSSSFDEKGGRMNDLSASSSNSLEWRC